MAGTRETQVIEVAQLGERLAVLRLCEPSALAAVRRSLEQHGQLTPLLLFADAGGLQIVDGFKRVRAARALGWLRLAVQICSPPPRSVGFRRDLGGGKPRQAARFGPGLGLSGGLRRR